MADGRKQKPPYSVTISAVAPPSFTNWPYSATIIDNTDLEQPVLCSLHFILI